MTCKNLYFKYYDFNFFSFECGKLRAFIPKTPLQKLQLFFHQLAKFHPKQNKINKQCWLQTYLYLNIKKKSTIKFYFNESVYCMTIHFIEDYIQISSVTNPTKYKQESCKKIEIYLKLLWKTIWQHPLDFIFHSTSFF